jgi:hypothetical protein
MNIIVRLFNRLFVCTVCVYECKGCINMNRGYLATGHKSKNQLVCGKFA